MATDAGAKKLVLNRFAPADVTGTVEQTGFDVVRTPIKAIP
jgi:hypothetical protein